MGAKKLAGQFVLKVVVSGRYGSKNANALKGRCGIQIWDDAKILRWNNY